MNSTTPYRPNWTYGSPASKLSTYMGIYQPVSYTHLTLPTISDV